MRVLQEACALLPLVGIPSNKSGTCLIAQVSSLLPTAECTGLGAIHEKVERLNRALHGPWAAKSTSEGTCRCAPQGGGAPWPRLRGWRLRLSGLQGIGDRCLADKSSATRLLLMAHHSSRLHSAGRSLLVDQQIAARNAAASRASIAAW